MSSITTGKLGARHPQFWRVHRIYDCIHPAINIERVDECKIVCLTLALVDESDEMIDEEEEMSLHSDMEGDEQAECGEKEDDDQSEEEFAQTEEERQREECVTRAAQLYWKEQYRELSKVGPSPSSAWRKSEIKSEIKSESKSKSNSSSPAPSDRRRYKRANKRSIEKQDRNSATREQMQEKLEEKNTQKKKNGRGGKTKAKTVKITP